MIFLIVLLFGTPLPQVRTSGLAVTWIQECLLAWVLYFLTDQRQAGAHYPEAPSSILTL